MMETQPWTTVVAHLLAKNFLVVFAFYSILLSLTRLSRKDKSLFQDFDRMALAVSRLVGLVWLILMLTSMAVFLVEMAQNQENELVYQHTLWFIRNTWFQWAIWIILLGLLWWPKTKNRLVPRVLFGISTVLSLEVLVIVITSYHRDFVPTGWSLFDKISQFFIWLPVRLLLFILVIAAIRLMVNSFRSPVE